MSAAAFDEKAWSVEDNNDDNEEREYTSLQYDKSKSSAIPISRFAKDLQEQQRIWGLAMRCLYLFAALLFLATLFLIYLSFFSPSEFSTPNKKNVVAIETNQPTIRRSFTRSPSSSSLSFAPTLLPSVSTPSPTTTMLDEENGIESNSPRIDSFLDKRFGAAQYSIPSEYVMAWNKQDEAKQRFKKSVFPSLKVDEKNPQFQAQVCELFPNPPVLYAMPKDRYEKRLSLNMALRHVRQFKYSLMEYYHRLDVRYQFYQGGDSVKQRLARFFREKISSGSDWRSLVIGAMGSSVMSGQDNCHAATYGPLLGRQMKRLLAPFQVDVEVRNMGQNGDGPNHQIQLLCAPTSLGNKVDFLHVWYAMMSPLEPLSHRQAFVKRMLKLGVVNVHSLVRGEAWCPLDVTGVCSEISDLQPSIDWTPQHFWGRVDSGLCHNRTREAYFGTLMQNWHFGPMGFEIFVDQATMMYADGLELALRSLLLLDDIASLPLLPPPPPPCTVNNDYEILYCSDQAITCVGGLQPNYRTTFDLKANHELALQASSSSWTWFMYKSPSRCTPNQVERLDSHYEQRRECQDFPDSGFVYEDSRKSRSWFDFSAPLAGRALRVFVCTGQRDTKNHYEKLGRFAVEFRVKNQLHDRMEYHSPKEDCLLLNRDPVSLEMGDVLSLRFDLSDPASVINGNTPIGFLVFADTSGGATPALAPSASDQDDYYAARDEENSAPVSAPHPMNDEEEVVAAPHRRRQ